MNVHFRTFFYFFFAVLTSSFLNISAFIATSYDPVHCMLPAPLARDASSSFFIGATDISGKWGLDSDERKVAFGEQYGTVKAVDLIKGLTAPTDESVVGKYLNSSGANYVDTDTTLRFNSTDNKYSFQSLHLGFTQHIISSLFIQCHAQLVKQSITLTPTADGTDSDIAAFLADFDNIIAEYGLPSMKHNTRPTTLERLVFFAGWGQHTELVNSIFEEIGGTISAGYVVTPPAFEHPLAPAALAYNISDGFIARVTGHAQIAKYIDARLDAATTIYNERYGTMRVVKDETSGSSFYAGPLLLGTGFVKKNPGTLWTLQLSVGLNRLFGLYSYAGYQLSYQETTTLKIKDTTTLSGMSSTPALQEIRLNTDPKLKRWKHHAIIFGAGFEPSHNSYRFLPRIEGKILFPLWGHLTANPAHSLAASGQFTLQWNW